MIQRLAIGWELSAVSGWGVFGLNLAKGLLAHPGAPAPMLLAEPNLIGLEPDDKRALVPLMVAARRLAPSPAPIDLPDALILDSLRNGLLGSPLAARARGAAAVGVVFLENAALDGAALTRADGYRHIFAGSTWNADLLRAAGIAHVSPLLQGIDPERFHPRPKTGKFADRFVVFSGGKLEYRKGQDLVVAAFKRFHETHPQALLIAAWSNAWPETLGPLERGGLVVPPPRTADGLPDLAAWLTACGLPDGSFIVPGLIPNARMPEVLREADAALFPNRAEGGTNLVAMEAMACGVPTILSANTGHLDLIAPDRCFPLTRQRPIPGRGTDGWGDSDVEEIVAALTAIFDDPHGAAQRGAAAAAFMRGMTWARTIETLLETIADW